MSLSLSSFVTAIGPGNSTQVLGVGGISPYTYSIIPGGPGGTINSSTGAYTAPSLPSSNPATSSEVIMVTDNVGATATTSILVGYPLNLFCDIIQNQMNLPQGRVYLWDQKIFEPTDFDPYVVVKILSCKPFANNNVFDSVNLVSIQSVNMLATLSVDIISRGPAARDRKEEIVLALNSNYSQSQQEINGFFIGSIPPGGQFVNLSGIDGAAIPYRFNISVNIQYFYTKTQSVPYLDTFSPVQVVVNA